MKTKLNLSLERATVTLIPETLGEQRILDLLVFRDTDIPRDERNSGHMPHAKVITKVDLYGHHSNGRAEKLELIFQTKKVEDSQ